MKILIVDDDLAIRTYLESALKVENHEVQTAENGLIGLSLFPTFKPDLILSDIQMPEMDGLEMLATIRSQDEDIIIIIMTGYGSEENAIKALNLGANNYLKKPILHPDLLNIIQKCETIVKTKGNKPQISELIQKREVTMKFGNDVEKLPDIIEHLIAEVGDLLPKVKQTGIRLSLMELLINAIEHGNFEITDQEKMEALETNKYKDLLKGKLENSPFAVREITVDFKQDPTGIEWIITDEGQGFDWKSIASPLEASKSNLNRGRGIFLSRFQFDELEFIGKGNQIRARLHLPLGEDE